MSSDHNPAMDEWIDRAKAADILDVATRLGAQMKRAGGAEHEGPCPVCGGVDTFSFNTKKGVFNCRKGGTGGSVLDMVMHVNGSDFIGACEFINQSDPPRGEARPVNDSYARERRDERRDREISTHEQDARELQNAKTNSEKLWDRGVAIEGTWAEKYLGRRGIVLGPGQSESLRFVPDLKYVGHANAEAGDKDLSILGYYPCMIAALRNIDGELIGVHRTYLDPETPAKLRPPGDIGRNAAKKMYGKAAGGGIWLGPVSSAIAISEGIETGLSWHALGRVPDDGLTVVAAYSLGNIACINLPDAVRKVHIIGDGDSNWKTTYPTLVKAIERFIAQGIEIGMVDIPRQKRAADASKGLDWNDVLLRLMRS